MSGGVPAEVVRAELAIARARLERALDFVLREEAGRRNALDEFSPAYLDRIRGVATQAAVVEDLARETFG